MRDTRMSSCLKNRRLTLIEVCFPLFVLILFLPFVLVFAYIVNKDDDYEEYIQERKSNSLQEAENDGDICNRNA